MHWQNVTDYSLWEPTWQSNRHNTKQAHMQGALWNQYTDPIEGENLMKLIHDAKQRQNKKTRTKYHPKNNTKCIIYTPHMSNIGPYEACTLCIQIHWVTHTPWKLTETYSGCHITQPIQHITLCCQGPWPT